MIVLKSSTIMILKTFLNGDPKGLKSYLIKNLKSTLIKDLKSVLTKDLKSVLTMGLKSTLIKV